MSKIGVVYSPKQVADPGVQAVEGKGWTPSPSARKPHEIAAALQGLDEIKFIEPEPVSIDDIKACHDPAYVDGVMSLQLENGFGTISQSVVDSLPYTNGAMYTAAKLARTDFPTCALVAGFHHACYEGWKGHGHFCTFNGLVIAARKLIQEGMPRVAIIDCDMHIGNGTENILCRSEFAPYTDRIVHMTFGKYYGYPNQAKKYLEELAVNGRVHQMLYKTKPSVIIYQAGVDVHVDDPYGGVLTTFEMYERDRRMFSIANWLGIPIAWDLAGGYQIDSDGSIQKVIDLHLNTFAACNEVYKFGGGHVFHDV